MPELDPASNARALARQAAQYAAGALEGAAARAFERRLGEDQQARDALCAAVARTRAASGQPALVPDPAYRERVRLSLRRRFWKWPRPQVYYGHPLVWAAAGATAAVVVMLTLLPASWSEPERPPPMAGSPANPEPEPEPITRAAEPAAAEVANLWAELNSSEHLARAHEEEYRRRLRAESRRMPQTDDPPARFLQQPTTKH